MGDVAVAGRTLLTYTKRSSCHTSSIVAPFIFRCCGAWRGRSRRATLEDSLPFRLCFLLHLSGARSSLYLCHLPTSKLDSYCGMNAERSASLDEFYAGGFLPAWPSPIEASGCRASFRQQPAIHMSSIGSVVVVSIKCEVGLSKMKQRVRATRERAPKTNFLFIPFAYG